MSMREYEDIAIKVGDKSYSRN